MALSQKPFVKLVKRQHSSQTVQKGISALIAALLQESGKELSKSEHLSTRSASDL